ncbi:hypothetical protein [Actinoallomurus soli]|uniref:hypothetical protein n=1 Tax=Actinoallomurus soli TaxID=2952535 RepID=UPI00209288A3|nr:hypothetical protein [Actinoallomurus soli]MCO5973433.1 hypothetical protein [Actinoallomurus soli]
MRRVPGAGGRARRLAAGGRGVRRGAVAGAALRVPGPPAGPALPGTFDGLLLTAPLDGPMLPGLPPAAPLSVPAPPGPVGDPMTAGAAEPDAEPGEGEPDDTACGDVDGDAVAGARTDRVSPALSCDDGSCDDGSCEDGTREDGAGGDGSDDAGDLGFTVAAEAPPAGEAAACRLGSGAAPAGTAGAEVAGAGAGRVRPAEGRTVRSRATDRCEVLVALASTVTGGSPRTNPFVRIRTRRVRSAARSPRSQWRTVVDPLVTQGVAGGSQAAGPSVVSTSRTPVAVPPTGRTRTAYSTTPGVTAATSTEASTPTSRTGAADLMTAAPVGAGATSADAGSADAGSADAGSAGSGSGIRHAIAGTVTAAVPTAASIVLDTGFTAVPPRMLSASGGTGREPVRRSFPLLPHDRGA